MKDKRQGNDLKVAWSIFKQDREPFRLEGLNVSLYLKSMFGRKPLNDFVITGNIIQWTFYGKDQKSSGKYSLEMVVNEGEKGMITTDACDFVNLVPCTCKIKNNEDELGVEIESIELESRVDLSSGEAVTIVVDSELSETSVNPVENRVITAEFNKKANKTEIPTKLSQLEQDIEIGGEVDLSDYPTREEVSENYLPREEFEERIEVYATHDSVQELSDNVTELSLEVSGISKRVDELEQGGQGGADEILRVEYGKTTFQEIYDAYKEGKYIVFEYSDNVFHINRVTATDIYFVSINGTIGYRVGIGTQNNWYQGVYQNEQSTNKVTTISDKSTDTQYPSAKAVYDALQNVGGGGTSSDKQGVVRQTQRWIQAADKGYDYVMQNVVRGAIPQANIDLFTSAGAVFNEQSGYFELNGLTDISYEEMRAIYNAGYKMTEGYWANVIRTNIFRPCNVNNVDAAQQYGFTGMYANRNCTAEVFKFTEQDVYGVAIKGQMYGAYDGCLYLKSFGNGVFVGQDSNISDQAFNKCYSLETIYIRSLKKNISFKDSARLSNASILYMIKNSAATSAIVITLHPDAKARAEADAEIMAALSEKTNVTLGV